VAAAITLAGALSVQPAVADCASAFQSWYDALPPVSAEGRKDRYARAMEYKDGEHVLAIYSYIDEAVFMQFVLQNNQPVSAEMARRFILVDDWLRCVEEQGVSPDSPDAVAFIQEFQTSMGKERIEFRKVAEGLL